MASFHAELEVAGHRYRVWYCSYEFAQATTVRGAAAGKVRHGPVLLLLDVPDEDTLLAWAAAPRQPLPGRVYFTDAQGAAHETLSWDAGECVGYREEFAARHDGTTAYRCWLTIAAPRLSITPGTPLTLAPPSAAPTTPAGAGVGPVVAQVAQQVAAAAASPAAASSIAHFDLDEAIRHVEYRDYSVPRKRGIGGAHNKVEFAKHRADYTETSRIPHAAVPGVEQVEYKIAALDITGQPTGALAAQTFEKTVYDPAVWPPPRLKAALAEALQDASTQNQGTVPTGWWEGRTREGHAIRGTHRAGKIGTFFFK